MSTQALEFASTLTGEISLKVVKQFDKISRPISFGTTQKFKVNLTLGNGSFSIVYQVQDLNNGRLYALKVAKHHHSTDKSKSCSNDGQQYLRKSLIEDFNIIKHMHKTEPWHLQHGSPQYIIKAHCIYQYSVGIKSTLCFTMDLHKQDLYALLRAHKKLNSCALSLEKIRSIAAQLLHTLSYLKSRNIVLHDLKPENILETYGQNIAITDFNLSEVIKTGTVTITDGTCQYNSPESVLRLLSTGFPHDMWSAACVFVELYTGEYLFQVRDNEKHKHLNMMRNVLGHTTPAIELALKSHSFTERYGSLTEMIISKTENVPGRDDFINLMINILKLNPEDRFTPEQALAHPFVRSEAIRLGLIRQQPVAMKPPSPPAALVTTPRAVPPPTFSIDAKAKKVHTEGVATTQPAVVGIGQAVAVPPPPIHHDPRIFAGTFAEQEPATTTGSQTVLAPDSLLIGCSQYLQPFKQSIMSAIPGASEHLDHWHIGVR